MSVISARVERLPAGVWSLDPVHSSIEFSVSYMVAGTFRSRFEVFSAHLTVEDDGTARLAGMAEPGSIAVKDPAFAEHLAAQDFFDVERYPELRFESTLVSRDGASIEVDGLLSIKDRTLPIIAVGTVADAQEDPSGNLHMGLQLQTRVDRRQFGLEWNMALPKGGLALGDEVTIHASLAFTKAT